MKTIYYQHPSQKDPSFGVYTKKENIVQNFSVHGGVNEILHTTKGKETSNLVFLLDNQSFVYFKFDVFRINTEGFSQQDLENIISEKNNHIKMSKNITAKFMTSYIDSFYVDSEEQNRLIGQTGEIFFRLYMVYVDDMCLNKFRSYYPDALESITILPQSFYTMLFVRNKMQRDNFALLYITKEAVKVVLIRDGFYDNVHTINLGLRFLKKIYKDNDILQYWNLSEQEIIVNPVALDLVTKSLQFYSEMLCKRLKEHNVYDTDIFLISSILKNGLFIDQFNTIYKRDSSSNYIIPFHYSSVLQKYGKKRKPGEMDVMIYLNKDVFIHNRFLHSNNENSGFTLHAL